jgi:uncharacterized protein involved in outer membrane biogenesis
MKTWMKMLIGVVVVLVVLVVALTLFLGQIVKGAVNTVGPKALGVPISVGSVNAGLLSGRFGLNDLVIGNPEGFKTPEAIRVKKVAVGVKMGSLLSKVIVIDRIYVDKPEITYELRLNGSNIGAIQAGLGASKPAAEPSKPAAEGKKAQINDVLIENGAIHLSTVGMAGHSATIPLPAIHLTDIGKESGGATWTEALSKVFDALGGAVTGAASGLGKGAKAVGDGAVETGKAIGDGAAKAVESVGKLFKK